jgi:shikimate dehydrogenase
VTQVLRFGLLGQDIGYSASPAMMSAAFAALGLPHTYTIEDVAPADLPDAVTALRDADVGGANVTTPHKAAVAHLVDDITPDAAQADAVNCVVRDGDRLVGHNTDLPAIMEELRSLRPDGLGRVVLLGAGGASRAVELAVTRLGGDLVRVARSDGSWARLPEHLANADLVINATPIGTGADESPIPAGSLRPDLAVFDLVYRPSPTRLVREARAAGATARAGAGMLLGQAWRSLELWLGAPAPIDAMRGGLRESVGDGVDA